MANCETGMVSSKMIIFIKNDEFEAHQSSDFGSAYVLVDRPGLSTVLPQKSWIIFLFWPKIDIFIPNLVCLYENFSHLEFD